MSKENLEKEYYGDLEKNYGIEKADKIRVHIANNYGWSFFDPEDHEHHRKMVDFQFQEVLNLNTKETDEGQYTLILDKVNNSYGEEFELHWESDDNRNTIETLKNQKEAESVFEKLQNFEQVQAHIKQKIDLKEEEDRQREVSIDLFSSLLNTSVVNPFAEVSFAYTEERKYKGYLYYDLEHEHNALNDVVESGNIEFVVASLMDQINNINEPSMTTASVSIYLRGCDMIIEDNAVISEISNDVTIEFINSGTVVIDGAEYDWEVGGSPNKLYFDSSLLEEKTNNNVDDAANDLRAMIKKESRQVDYA